MSVWLYPDIEPCIARSQSHNPPLTPPGVDELSARSTLPSATPDSEGYILVWLPSFHVHGGEPVLHVGSWDEGGQGEHIGGLFISWSLYT